MPTRRGELRSTRRWTNALGRACLVASILCMSSALLGRDVAYADAPAVTDFGQLEVQSVMTPPVPPSKSVSHAVFMTLYEDGHGQVEIRSVRNDALASFAGDHPAWKLDEGLRWFVQMPVYVKQVSLKPAPFTEHVAV